MKILKDNKEEIRSLTEEEKQKVLKVLNELFPEEWSKEPSEYDVLMNKKTEEFKQHILKDNYNYEIEALIEMCEKYLNDTSSFAGFGLIIEYDMWLNNSACWPIGYNPEWEEWNKLKEIKVDKSVLP